MSKMNEFTPFGFFLLGEDPTVEDFILLIGTVVAFIAFILWCCFPIHPKDNLVHQTYTCKSIHALKVQHSADCCSGRQENVTATKYNQRIDGSNSACQCYSGY